MSLVVGAHPSPVTAVVRQPDVHRPGLSQAERWAGLLVASGRGEQASFELLAQETRGSLLVRALRIVPDVGDAGEVVYDSLLEAWCTASRYDPLRWAASTWLGQIIIADHHGVRAGLQSLTDRQRQAVRLAYHEGLTSVQSAARLGVPVATMRSRLHDGIGRLRGAVNGPEPAS
jgi:RNA polymerase sigma-70 factor (ECF subfamily)